MLSTSAPPPQPQILLFARAVLAVLDLWPALTIAVKESWGGPESSEKKTWIASTLIDEFESRTVFSPPSPSGSILVDPKSDHPLDFDEIADLLHQVMSDEFDANLEDGSIEIVARDLGRVWEVIVQKGDVEGLREVEILEKRVEERKGKGVQATKGSGPDVGEDGEELSDDSEDGSDDEDEDGMEVDEAPALVPRERVEKVVDEDGFELVQKGNKRK